MCHEKAERVDLTQQFCLVPRGLSFHKVDHRLNTTCRLHYICNRHVRSPGQYMLEAEHTLTASKVALVAEATRVGEREATAAEEVWVGAEGKVG